MEIEGITGGLPLKGAQGQIPLQVGDQLIGRVVRRLRPFSYLIAFRGKTFPVNSSVYLADNQKVLLELIDVKPRLKFKLVSTLPNSHKMLVAKWLKILNLPEGPLNKSFMSWALRLGLSVDREEFAFLSSLLAGQKDILPNAPELLAAYLWVRWHQSNQALPQSAGVLNYFFFQSGRLSPKNSAEKKEQKDTVILEDEFFELFLESKPLAKLLKKFINLTTLQPLQFGSAGEEKESDFEGNPEEEFVGQLKIYLYLQKLWRAGEWVCFPFFQKHLRKKFFTFWRRKGHGDEMQIEFAFSRSVTNKAPLTIKGCLRQNVLDLEIFSPSKVFLNLAEKYNSKLALLLEENDLILGGLNLVEKDEDWGVADILFKQQQSYKIEALI
ncbi:MAG: hypothetical protein Kow0037_19680 [Calditrichia bacterium]